MFTTLLRTLTHKKFLHLSPLFILSMMCNSLAFPGIAMAQSPGGISSNLYLWLKAGAGVTQSGGQVSAWANQGAAAMTTQPSATASSAITQVSNGINFNPVIRCNGTKSLLGTYTAAPTNPPLIFAVAIGRTGTGQQNAGNIYSNGPAGGTGMMYDATAGTYWVDASGSRCSYTPSMTNQAALARVFYNSATNVAGSYTATNGIANSTCTSWGLSTSSGQVEIAGRTWDWGGIGRYFVGDLAEVVYLNSNTATALQINQVESYLALKYGISLGSTSSPLNYTASDGSTIFWRANSTYQNNVFGIGKDNGSGLSQTQSNNMNLGSGNGAGQSGKGNLILTAQAALADKQFLTIGDDGGALTEQLNNIPLNSSGATRVSRTWLTQNTGNVGAVNLSFDMNGFTYTGGNTAFNYALVVNTNGSTNFATSSSVIYVASSITGNQINFTGVNLPNNAVFTIVTMSGNVLPVTWVNFTATLQNNAAKLNWTVSEQANVDYYEVEQSFDGVSYTTVGQVAATDNTGINQYQYNVASVSTGLSYYRIKMVEFGGSSSYSVVRSISSGQANRVTIEANPVVGQTLRLLFYNGTQQNAFISIFNVQGQLIKQQAATVQNGSTRVQVNLSNVPSGMYIVSTLVDSQVTAQKFIKE